MKESDLSGPLTHYLLSLGYCVHGEVSVFDRSRTIDHVAHTGPCHCPEYMLFFEMKTAFNKDIVQQTIWSDLGHYADGLYFVTPQKRGYADTHPLWQEVLLKKWYVQPGWITCQGQILHVIEDAKPISQKYHKKNTYRVLLTDKNKDTQAGFRSGVVDVDTHWKAGVRYVSSKGKDVSMDNLLEDMPHFMAAYRHPKRALQRMVVFLKNPKRKR